MARIKNSPLEGLRGTLGDLVFRTYGGRTYVNPKPQQPKGQTIKQKATRTRFAHAAINAKQVLSDPVMLLHYEYEAGRLGLPNAYTAALRDQLLGVH